MFKIPLIIIFIFTIISAKTPNNLELSTYDKLLKQCERNNKVYMHNLEKTNNVKYRDSIMTTLEIYASLKQHKQEVAERYAKNEEKILLKQVRKKHK